MFTDHSALFENDRHQQGQCERMQNFRPDSILRGVLYFAALHLLALIPNLMIVSALVKLSGANKETIAYAPVFGLAILAFSSLLYQVPLALYLRIKGKNKTAQGILVCAAIFAILQLFGYGVLYLGFRS